MNKLFYTKDDLHHLSQYLIICRNKGLLWKYLEFTCCRFLTTDLCSWGCDIGQHLACGPRGWSHQTELCLGVSSLRHPGTPGLSLVAPTSVLCPGAGVGAQQGCINISHGQTSGQLTQPLKSENTRYLCINTHSYGIVLFSVKDR